MIQTQKLGFKLKCVVLTIWYRCSVLTFNHILIWRHLNDMILMQFLQGQNYMQLWWRHKKSILHVKCLKLRWKFESNVNRPTRDYSTSLSVCPVHFHPVEWICTLVFQFIYSLLGVGASLWSEKPMLFNGRNYKFGFLGLLWGREARKSLRIILCHWTRKEVRIIPQDLYMILSSYLFYRLFSFLFLWFFNFLWVWLGWTSVYVN